MKKAFTIFELIVAMALMVILLAGSGLVFRMSAEVHRKAAATAEISRKLLAMVQQLDQDFEHIRHDGEILMAWVLGEIEDSGGTTIGYERFDRVMFFANGDFHSYKDTPSVRGNIARISYMIASPDEFSPIPSNPRDRVLARVQHIYTADASLNTDTDFTSFDVDAFYLDERDLEYDKTAIAEWKNLDNDIKEDMLTVIMDLLVDFDGGGIGVSGSGKPVGAEIDVSQNYGLHKLFCEGVGEFKIQLWHDQDQRWYPEVYKDIDGNWVASDNAWLPDVADKDGDGDSDELNTLISPGRFYIGDDTFSDLFGRAFKFTFTLYDSNGVFPEGKTFTHIVYLD